MEMICFATAIILKTSLRLFSILLDTLLPFRFRIKNHINDFILADINSGQNLTTKTITHLFQMGYSLLSKF